jgi:hypothetical protein
MKLRFHVLLLALLALGVGLLFLDEPKFGDDFTYWYHGFNVHQRGLEALSKDSFHQLRWPVWGVCWAVQGIVGPGLISYYATPYLYLILGALAAFAVGRKLSPNYAVAWACGLAFLFHPLLDTLIFRPMPDVGEGVLCAGAVLAWWSLMHAASRGRLIVWSLVVGALCFVAVENRLTGLFFIPLLGCLTLLFHPRKLPRLFLALAVFGVLLLGQMAFYHSIFPEDGWTHFLKANAGAKNRQGTDPVGFWTLPFRFLDSLAKGSPLAPVYSLFAAAGLWFGWRKNGAFGRVVVAWFILLYLAYACAPQDLRQFPYLRPMLRDADRFLAGLAIPFSVLAVMGLRGLLGLLQQARAPRWRELPAGLTRHPLATGCAAFGVLVLLSAQPLGDRGFFTLSYVHEFRAYMRSRPDHTRVFTHHHMRGLAMMVDEASARRFEWEAPKNSILISTPEIEAAAARSDEFWYIRKLALLRQFKSITAGDTKQPPLSSFLESPEREWRLMRVLAKDDTPDIVLYTRRRPGMEPPVILEANAPEFKDLIPALPFEWKKGEGKLAVEKSWPIPPLLRGRLIRFEMNAASPRREAFDVRVTFIVHGKAQPAFLLKPYFFQDGGKEFGTLDVPADAESCTIRIHFDKNTPWVRVTDFQLVAEREIK